MDRLRAVNLKRMNHANQREWVAKNDSLFECSWADPTASDHVNALGKFLRIDGFAVHISQHSIFNVVRFQAQVAIPREARTSAAAGDSL